MLTSLWKELRIDVPERVLVDNSRRTLLQPSMSSLNMRMLVSQLN